MTDNKTSNVVALPAERERHHGLHALVGTSSAIEAVRKQVLRAASSMATVVVTGETGSGKELVARALHACAPRRSEPFVAANAATFSPDLLGSELFGHSRGAFTGAVETRRGLFAQADHGTLFLDEIAELSFAAQAALLRVLETGEVRAVGAERVTRVHVRLVVATHRDLYAMVKAGKFRLDLFFRLHVLAITIPPLRERIDDVVPLALHVLEKLRPEVGTRSLTIPALRFLELYAWPGNVRQLVNVLRRAAVLTADTELDLPVVAEALAAEPEVALPESKASPLTPAAISAAIEDCRGNVARAAKMLGMPRSTLRERLHRMGLHREA